MARAEANRKTEGAFAARKLRERALNVNDLAVRQSIRKHRAALSMPIPKNSQYVAHSTL